MDLLNEADFFEQMHESIDRASRATKPEDMSMRELLHVQHMVLDQMLDKLRMEGGK